MLTIKGKELSEHMRKLGKLRVKKLRKQVGKNGLSLLMVQVRKGGKLKKENV